MFNATNILPHTKDPNDIVPIGDKRNIIGTWLLRVCQIFWDCQIQTLLTPAAPDYIISSVYTEVITNSACCSLHGSYWRIWNNWGRIRRLIQTCSIVVDFFPMGESRECRDVVVSKRDRKPNQWWLPLIAIVDNIYKPWVLRQKVCGVSPMQCKYWNFLEMGQAPNRMFLLSSLHIPGVGGRCGLFYSDKPWKTTRMNIARPTIACLKFTPSHIYQEHALLRKIMLW